jgi:hypothetical protein
MKNVCENKLTHVHKVIHKVIGTFARVFERKRKVETLSPSCLASSTGFGEFLEVFLTKKITPDAGLGGTCVSGQFRQ